MAAAEVMSSDLRASAALVLAGIVSKGKSIVGREFIIVREVMKILKINYKKLVLKLKIKIVKYLAKIIAK